MTDLGQIPDELKARRQWVCADADSKLPKKALSPGVASVSDPGTWCSFAEAADAVARGVHDNVGYIFAPGDDIVGIDVDAGYDEDGLITPTAADIIGACHSYTERSRSGRGFHIFLRGFLPFPGRNNRRGVEAYREGRYFIMTGDVFMYREMRTDQAAIDHIVDSYFREPETDGETVMRIKAAPRIYSPLWNTPGRTVPLRPVYPLIPEGCRNICLLSLAGMMRNIGYSGDQIRAELEYCNRAACAPPLDAREVRSIVRSVMRYRK